MPVHEIRYRPWEGDLLPTWKRLISIPKFSLMASWNRTATLSMFSGVIHLVIYIGFLVITTNTVVQKLMDIPAAHLNSFNLAPWRVFANFYMLQFFVCLGIALSIAPRLISSERAHKALPLIYSRPITRLGYIAGKVAAVAIPLSLVTWVSTGFLFIAMLSIYPPEHSFWNNFLSEQVPLAFGAMAVGLIMTLTLSTFFLACSAATKSHVFASVLPLLILFGLGFMTRLLQETVLPAFPDLGLRELQMALSELLIYPAASSSVSIRNTAISLLIWLGGSLGFMFWRLRPVDVYTE